MKEKLGLFILLFILGCNASRHTDEIDYQTESRERMLEQQIDSLHEVIYSLQKQNIPLSPEPGKVYVRCAFEPRFESYKSRPYYVYNGQLPSEEAKDTMIIIRPAYLKWIKTTSSRICKAYDDHKDESCELWHLKEYPPVYKVVKIVKDTNITKTFEIKTYDIDTLITESSLTRVREFGCPSVYHETQIIEKIQNALISKGYDLNGAENNKLGKITKEALLLFQKNNNLSVGNLDLETLRKLGIK